MTGRAMQEITEYLGLDTEARQWVCRRCGHRIGSADVPYKRGCLIAARDPSEIWRPLVEAEYTFSYDPGWARVVEFYCPGCAALFEVELLPPGHPLTDDIRVDIDALADREPAGGQG